MNHPSHSAEHRKARLKNYHLHNYAALVEENARLKEALTRIGTSVGTALIDDSAETGASEAEIVRRAINEYINARTADRPKRPVKGKEVR